MLYRPFDRNSASGFTMVELAISLTVIGLLLGGILKGEELLGNVRATRTITDIQRINQAINSFREVYDGALPGDFKFPSTRIPNCTTTPCTTAGNGDGIIGGTNSSFTATLSFASTTENAVMWSHLATAGYLPYHPVEQSSNVIAQQGPGDASFDPVYYERTTASGGYPIIYGHYLLAKFTPSNAAAAVNAGDYGAFTPRQAAQIDRKLDDGLPYSGNIFGVSNTAACFNGTSYNESVDLKNCNLLSKLK